VGYTVLILILTSSSTYWNATLFQDLAPVIMESEPIERHTIRDNPDRLNLSFYCPV
jgi:hypothetical protein